MNLNGSRARAAAMIIAWLTLSAVPALAQDSIAEARKLYQAAYYDEALTILERLQSDPAAGGDADLAQYRVLCLLALGRNAEANVEIEDILRRNTQFKPSEADTSPRIRAVFDAARRRLLPQIFQERYEDAKAAFARKEFSVAADQFSSLAALLDDPALMGEDTRSDLKVVVAGFADLSRAAAVKPSAPAPSSAPAPAAAVPATSAASRVYSAGAVGVIPPVAISKPLPPLPRGNSVLLRREYVGVLDIIINEEGRVSEVVMRKSVHPQFDFKLVSTVRTWKFQPATKDGRPVSYRSVFELKLIP